MELGFEPTTWRSLISAPTYFGPDRRRRRRLPLDEITEQEADQALREYVAQMPEEELLDEPESWWQKALEVLDLPRNAIANLIAAAAGIKGSSKEKFAGLKKVYGSDILRGLGLQTGSGAADFVLGLTADIISDPLSYLGVGALGQVGRGAKVGGKLLKGSAAAAAKSAEGLSEAARLSRVAGAVGKDVGEALAGKAGGGAASDFLRGLGLQNVDELKRAGAIEEAASMAGLGERGALDAITGEIGRASCRERV